MTQAEPQFFGFGSLVNPATHDFADPRPMALQGWCRVWQATSLRKAAFLSVQRDENCQIDGVLAHVPDGDWRALDRRETGYQRIDVSPQVPGTNPTALYQIDPAFLQTSGASHPILLSYLDVVVQGYFQMFGAAGVARFFATTSGWSLPVLNDRKDPIYPRSQHLTDEETARVDRYLADLNIRLTDQSG